MRVALGHYARQPVPVFVRFRTHLSCVLKITAPVGTCIDRGWQHARWKRCTGARRGQDRQRTDRQEDRTDEDRQRRGHLAAVVPAEGLERGADVLAKVVRALDALHQPPHPRAVLAAALRA